VLFRSADDRCPRTAGEVALGGCLPPDGDADGVPDERDACPAVAAPKSLRGCLDVDGDGLDALDDACPDLAGVAELKGCPDQDSDGDGVVDRLDACRTAKGGRANQGCPESEKLLVVITRDRLVIRDKVYFATGKSEVLKQSFALLQQIARILREHPEVERVSI
jgi:outer membrane protein OmpA-like peptidoglycan-associated protein